MRIDSARSLKEELRALMSAGFGSFGAIAGVGASSGLALGLIQGATRSDWRLAVRLHQRSQHAFAFAARINSIARGEVDAQFVGTVYGPRAFRAGTPALTSRVRPLFPGVSIAHQASTAGTLGAFAYNANNELVILSNNHVLCADGCSIGDGILQPGPIDGGRSYPNDMMARLSSFLGLDFQGVNHVDAATAVVMNGVQCVPRYCGGELAGICQDPVAGLRVCKIGRTTGFTRGIVRAIEVDGVEVRYGNRTVVFDNQIEIAGLDGAFSDGGDSGALILDSNRRAVGLLFAGTPEAAGKTAVTYANPIDAVVNTLGLRLV